MLFYAENMHQKYELNSSEKKRKPVAVVEVVALVLVPVIVVVLRGEADHMKNMISIFKN